MVEIKDSTKINFPLRSFNNVEWNEQYTFYRQGQVVTTKRPVDEAKDGSLPNGLVVQYCEQMTKVDLGDMYLAFEKALIVRSSNSILIFKKVLVEQDDPDGEGTIWIDKW